MVIMVLTWVVKTYAVDDVPHLRRRHIIDLVKNSLIFSPIVGLLGHRQVGKTTFLNIFTNHY